MPVTREYGSREYEKITEKVKAYQGETDDLAFVVFTSGTSGEPKGVMLTDDNIISNLEAIGSYFRLENRRTICIGRPLVHIAVLTGELLYALCSGLTVHFYEESFMPRRLLSFFERYQIDVFGGTPTLYRALARAARGQIFPIRTAVLSGEVLTETAAREIAAAFPGTEFYHVYGLTEHSPRVSALPPSEFRRRATSVGKPIAGISVRLEDGELWVRSKSVMKGYLEDEERTRDKITDGWLHTGDLARFDGEGNLYIDGRKDGMLIRAGLNVYPEAIENAVKEECAEVADCLVYGEQTEGSVTLCMKYVGEISERDLKRKLAERLNNALLPGKIQRVEELPKTPSGKKLRR